MRDFVQDLQRAVRNLAANPRFAMVAVLTLALGIGANTAIFTVVNAVLLRPLPYPESQKLLSVEELHSDYGTTGLTYATFLDFRARSRTAAQWAAYRWWTFTVVDEREPESIHGSMISAEFAEVLGVRPVLGRFFTAEEDRPGAEKVAVIGYGLWQRRFGSRQDIVGRRIKINGLMTTIVGVMPAGFREPMQSELWVPLVATGEFRENRRAHLLRVFARLKADETLESARAELAGLASQITAENAQVDPGMGLHVTRMQEHAAAPVRPALLVLLAAVGCVLLIACANLSNLLLVRGARRTREFAIRSALGASRVRLMRHVLAESLLLAVCGGISGGVLAMWMLKVLRRYSPVSLADFGAFSLDARVAGFAAALTLAAGLLCGLPLALQLTRGDLSRDLGEGRYGSGGRRQHRLRSVFVAAQSALALMLLAGAGLLVRSFLELLRVPLGIEPHGVLTLQVFLSPQRYSESNLRAAGLYVREILERVKNIPGVRSVGMTDALPLLGDVSTDFEIVGRPAPKVGEEPEAYICIADEDLFRTMGIRLLQGREFTKRDTFEAPRVMIINETMARRFWPGESPLGRKVTMKDWGPPLTGEIVGVVADVKLESPDRKTGPAIYWPYQQFSNPFATLVVKTDWEAARILPAIKGQVWAVDREQPISSVQWMDEALAEVLAPRKFNTWLLGVFAGAALLLAAMGVYAMLSQAVIERTKEIGIRMALGAQQERLVRMVVMEGMLPVLAGTTAGMIGALALARMIAGLLFGVQAQDAVTFGIVPLVFVGVALVACYLPARRVTQLNPMNALREE